MMWKLAWWQRDGLLVFLGASGFACAPPPNQCGTLDPGTTMDLHIVRRSPLVVSDPSYPPCPLDDFRDGDSYLITLGKPIYVGACVAPECPDDLPSAGTPQNDELLEVSIRYVCVARTSLVQVASDCALRRSVKVTKNGIGPEDLNLFGPVTSDGRYPIQIVRELRMDSKNCSALPASFAMSVGSVGYCRDLYDVLATRP